MKNYKTTISGFIIAILMAIQPIAENGFDLQKDWLKYSIAIGIALFGFMAKDQSKDEA